MTDQIPRFLLLLPPITDITDDDLVKGVVGDSIKEVLKEVALASHEIPQAAILEVALALPHLLGPAGKDFNRYDLTQNAVARIYRTVCIIAAREQINVEDSDGVNVRVLLVGWDGSSDEIPRPSGIIPPLEDLARCQRQWQYAFGVENDLGTAMVKAFVATRGSKTPTGSGPRTQSGIPQAGESPSRMPCVAVGGTFDHIHIGHKLLLTMTVFAALDKDAGRDTDRSVIVGVTGNELLKNKKYAEYLESWHDRQKIVYDFIEALVDFGPSGTASPKSEEVKKPGPNGHAVDTVFANGIFLRCVEISDPFGPTITEPDIDALIISAETRAGGKAVNDKRVEQGWQPLKVLEVDVLDADDPAMRTTSQPTQTEDFSSKISSTEIRRKLASKGRMSAL